MMRFPPPRDFINTTNINLTTNYTVTTNGIRISNKIYFPDVRSLKGKLASRVPKNAPTNYIDIPQDTLKIYKDLTLVSNIMFVNRMHLLVGMSYGIKFTTEKYVDNRTKPTVVASITKMLTPTLSIIYMFPKY